MHNKHDKLRSYRRAASRNVLGETLQATQVYCNRSVAILGGQFILDLLGSQKEDLEMAVSEFASVTEKISRAFERRIH